MATKENLKKRATPADWRRVNSLYDKVLFWLYERGDAKKARPHADRLERLLTTVDSKGEAIFGEECRSLIHETNGDVSGAITHRRNEIRLIRKLRRLCVGKPHEEFVLQQYGIDDLSDRLDLLASLYHRSGDLDKALKTLKESKRICKNNAVPFDGEDLLREYMEEMKITHNGRR